MQNSTPPNTIAHRSHHLGIGLDPSEAENQTRPMCLTPRVIHGGAWPSPRWVGRRMWVKYTAPDAFERASRSGQEAVSMHASDRATLRVVPGDRRTHVPITPAKTRRSADGETSAIELAAEPGPPAGLAQACPDVPRWR